MIEVQDLTKSYHKGDIATPVLRGVTFRIAPGEFVAIMGASGSGKSTLMNILGFLDQPDGGTYRFEDRELTGADDAVLSALRNRSIGFVFQQFHLLDRASALENVMLPFLYAEQDVADETARATRALEAVGLGDRLHQRPSELSGGQQQRVATARALVNDPDLILADEPTGNLDAHSSLEILALLQTLHGTGRTIVVVTHDADVAEHTGRILVLADGRITEDRPVRQPRDARGALAEGVPAGEAT
jgi:ABC-type lipoprotein export system ATPase subunit